MGQRANYVIKNGDQLSIHYNHWRANSIAADLYLGEKAFLRYIHECTAHNGLMDPIWMEGFVIVDIKEKQLGFWAWQFEAETSVIRYYLSALQNKWPGWQIMYLANYMYDAEPLLGIDYVSQQTIPEFEPVDATTIMNDPDDYAGFLFIIRERGEIFVGELNYILAECIISYGEEVIPLLRSRPAVAMPAEGNTPMREELLIDVDNKYLIVNDSIFGLWETMACKWPGYKLKMGRIGHLALLEQAGISTAGLEMPKEKVREIFSQITAVQESYDSGDLYDKLTKVPGLKIEAVNAHFFDAVSPRTSFIQQIIQKLRQYLKGK